MKGDMTSEAARLLGQIGGKSRSRRKQDAVRENGKLGGRPVGVKELKPRAHSTVPRKAVMPRRDLVLDGGEFSQE